MKDKKLVAYFSCSGVTKAVANTLAKAADADLFEIVPKDPYTNADCDWTDKNSRSSREMNNLEFRPEIAKQIDNMDEYKVVFIGFPIWWYIAPTIINTFFESYDFSGKTVVLFATSGGSGILKAENTLRSLYSNAVWKSGKVINGNPSAEKLSEWVKSLNL